MTELYETLLGPIGQRLTWTLIHFFWQGLGIVLLLIAICWAFRVRQAAVRYAMSVFALLVMAACLPITFTLLPNPPPAKSAPRLAAAGTAAPTTAAERTVSWKEPSPVVGHASLVADQDAAPIVARPRMNGAKPLMPSPAKAAVPAAAQRDIPDREPVIFGSQISNLDSPPSAYAQAFSAAQPYLLMLWILGVCLLSVRMLMGLIGARRMSAGKAPVSAELDRWVRELARKLKFKKIPRAFSSVKMGEAVALGFFRPMILIPAAWLMELPPEALQAVIAHELAHIRRWDLWVNLFQRFIETLLFYHPAVWWLSRRIRLEREMCCDELAVRATGERVAYAEALHQVARRYSRTMPPAVAAAAATIGGKKMAIFQRVQYILGVSPSGDGIRWWPVGLLTALAPVALWYGLSAASPPAKAEDISTTPAVGKTATTEKPASTATVSKDAAHADPLAKAEGPNDKQFLLRMLRAQARKRTLAMRSGQVEINGTVDVIINIDSQKPESAVASMSGRVYFNDRQIRSDTRRECKAKIPAELKPNGGKTEPPELVELRTLSNGQWMAEYDSHTGNITLKDLPADRNPGMENDLRWLGLVEIRNLDQLTAAMVVEKGQKRLRLEETIPHAGIRIVQILDPDRDYILLRRESYSLSQKDANLGHGFPFDTITFEYEFLKRPNLWLPVKYEQQSYNVTTEKISLKSAARIAFTHLSLSKPPAKLFTLYNFAQGGPRKLVDQRAGAPQGMVYNLPQHEQNLVLPSLPDKLNLPGQAAKLPPDLEEQWLKDARAEAEAGEEETPAPTRNPVASAPSAGPNNVTLHADSIAFRTRDNLVAIGKSADSGVKVTVRKYDAPKTRNDPIWDKLGLILASKETQFKHETRPHERLVVTEVRPESPAAKAGIRAGDVLVGLHDVEIWKVEDVLKVLNKPELAAINPLKFFIRRGEEQLYGYLPLELPTMWTKQIPKAEKPKIERTYDGKTFEEWKRLALTELKAETWRKAFDALEAFGKAGRAEEVVGIFREFLDQGADVAAINKVYEIVAWLGPAAEPLILDGLKSKDPRQRKAVLITYQLPLLVPIHPPYLSKPIIEAILKATEDKDDEVRGTAYGTVICLTHAPEAKQFADRIISLLFKIIRGEVSEIRIAGIDATANSSGIIGVATEGDRARLSAINALKGFDVKAADAVPALIEIVRNAQKQIDQGVSSDPSEAGISPADERTAALKALADIGPAAKAAVPLLEEIFNKRDPWSPPDSEVQKVLQKITGKRYEMKTTWGTVNGYTVPYYSAPTAYPPIPANPPSSYSPPTPPPLAPPPAAASPAPAASPTTPDGRPAGQFPQNFAYHPPAATAVPPAVQPRAVDPGPTGRPPVASLERLEKRLSAVLADNILQRSDKGIREKALAQLKKMLAADSPISDKITALTALEAALPARFDRQDFVDLVVPLLKSEQAYCRRLALKCLPGLMPADRALPLIITLADDPERLIRAAAASALVQTAQGKHPEQVIPAMMKFLQDKDIDVVRDCLRSQWGQYSSPELDELFIKLSRDQRYRHDAVYFCLSTQQKKSPAVCRRLVEALDEGDGRAAWGLGYGVGKDSRALVEEGLLKALPEETNSYTRQQEFEALKNVVSAKSWKYLKLVADSEEEPEEIKRLAREILEKLYKDGVPIKPAVAPGIK